MPKEKLSKELSQASVKSGAPSLHPDDNFASDNIFAEESLDGRYSDNIEPEEEGPTKAEPELKTDPMERIAGLRSTGGRKLYSIADVTAALVAKKHEHQEKTDSYLSRDSAVKSVKKGTAYWRAILKPFVSNLAFRCVQKRRAETGVSFHAWSGHAACLFIDISGYSKVTAALAQKGAYALSSIVNSYMDKILNIVNNYGGDVVKFAGDAMFIVWEGNQENLRENVFIAALCARDLQLYAGHFPVEGTELSFRIHTGMSCG